MPVSTVKRRPEVLRTEKIWIRTIWIAVLGIVCTIALQFLAAFLMLRKELSAGILPIFAYCSCAIPAFLCGFLCAKIVPRHKALFGMLSAVPILLAVLGLCLFLYKTVGGGYGAGCAIVLCASAIGAILAVRKRPKKRKYK